MSKFFCKNAVRSLTKILTASIAVFCSLWVAMPVYAQSPKPNALPASDEIALVQAYVNYMLKHHPRIGSIYFLRLSPPYQPKKSVLESLFAKLAQGSPPVFEVGNRVKYGGGFTDKKTKKAAMLYRLRSIKLGNNQVEIDGGWVNGGRSGVLGKYKLVKAGAHWVVKGEKIYGRN